METVAIKINGRDYTVKAGSTVLEAARVAGIEIPTLCYLKDINEIGACRLCLVEVAEKRGDAVLQFIWSKAESEVVHPELVKRVDDAVIAVIADTETRMARIMKRDGIGEEMAMKRISKQKPNEFYLERADYIIENGAHAEKDALIRRVSAIVSALKERGT